MSEEDKNLEDNQLSEVNAVDKYLFQGKWVETDGVKWAFFDSEKDQNSHNKRKKPKPVFSEKIKVEETVKIEKTDISEKVSITDLGRASGGRRYGEEIVSEISSSGRLEPDTVLSGRYKILEFHKSFENRDFYMAKDTRLDTPCIVKELACDISDREEKDYYNKRFKEEAKLLAALRHPNLPTVIDYFVENGRTFMVIDYIKGFDLETLLGNKEIEITEEQVLLWGLDICEVLEYIHDYNPPIIHRGISPASLFIRDRDWAVILYNFSFARRQDKTSTYKIGHSGFAPPEQLVGKAQTRSDIYSLGATLYYLLTGKIPNEKFKYLSPSSINPTVSIYTDMALKNALKLNVKERFVNAEEMKEALLDSYDKLLAREEEESPEEDIFDKLSEMLLQKEHRFKAIKRLGKIGDPRAIDLLIPFLQDDSAAIRLAVISAFETLNEKRTIGHLSKLLDDDNFEIRKKSIKIIEKLSGKKLPPLMIVPRDSDLFSS